PEILPVEWSDVLTASLVRQTPPDWAVKIEHDNAIATIVLDQGNLPAKTQVTYRFDQRKPTTMLSSTTQPAIAELAPGHHVLTAQAELADGRAYQKHEAFTIDRATTPRPAWTAQVNGAVLSHLARSGDALYATTMGNDLVA